MQQISNTQVANLTAKLPTTFICVLPTSVSGLIGSSTKSSFSSPSEKTPNSLPVDACEDCKEDDDKDLLLFSTGARVPFWIGCCFALLGNSSFTPFMTGEGVIGVIFWDIWDDRDLASASACSCRARRYSWGNTCIEEKQTFSDGQIQKKR